MAKGPVGEDGETKVEKQKAWENPLIPHARLREMYVRMVEARAVAARLRVRGSKGQEAARVSTAVSLEPGDLTVEARRSGLTAWLRGTRLRDVVRGSVQGEFSAADQVAVLGAAARVWAACGAGAALKLAGGKRIALIYVGSGELDNPVWREVLRFAAGEELPVVFVLLPRTGATESGLGGAERRSGVPCLGVDAADAVALYRVAQESVGRARAGGGPALMECMTFPGVATADAIGLLGQSLVKGGLVTEAWRRRVEESIAKRLKGLTRA